MKFLIAFALFATAFAVDEIKVVHLPEAPTPAFEPHDFMRPLIISQAAIDSIMAQLVNVNEDVLRTNLLGEPAVPEQVVAEDINDVAANEESFKVHFVDNAVEEIQDPEVVVYQSSVAEESDGVEAFIADPESLKVNFVDSPVEDFQVPEPIKIAEAPLPESFVEYHPSEDNVFTANEESMKVQFVDAPVDYIQTPEVVIYRYSVAEESDGVDAFIADPESLKVNFVDSPVEDFQAPEPIMIAEAPSPVNVVEYNISEDNTFAADEESMNVRFVHAPVGDSFGAVKIAEPVFDSRVPSVETVKVVEAPRLGKLFEDLRLR